MAGDIFTNGSSNFIKYSENVTQKTFYTEFEHGKTPTSYVNSLANLC